MYTPFWFNQIDILYDKNYLLEIFPVKEYDLIRKLNAVFRFSIYYSLIVYFYNRNTNMFAVPIITALVTYAIWYKHKDIQVSNMQNKLKNDVPVTSDPYNYNCNLPTRNNPFMNPSFMDVSADKPLPKACSSYDNKGVQRRMETNFNKGLYRNYTDIFGKENSQRQFFTVPGREGVPDQSAFAKWLYETPGTCKEGTNPLACLSVGQGNGGGQGVPA